MKKSLLLALSLAFVLSGCVSAPSDEVVAEEPLEPSPSAVEEEWAADPVAIPATTVTITAAEAEIIAVEGLAQLKAAIPAESVASFGPYTVETIECRGDASRQHVRAYEVAFLNDGVELNAIVRDIAAQLDGQDEWSTTIVRDLTEGLYAVALSKPSGQFAEVRPFDEATLAPISDSPCFTP